MIPATSMNGYPKTDSGVTDGICGDCLIKYFPNVVKNKYVRLSPTVLFRVPGCYGEYDRQLQPAIDLGIPSSYDKCKPCVVRQQCELNQDTVVR